VRWLDDATDPAASTARLTTNELAAVVERVGGIAVPPPLAAALERYLAANPGRLIDVMRCLLTGAPAAAAARLERLVATQPDRMAAATPDRGVLRRRGDLWEVEYPGRDVCTCVTPGGSPTSPSWWHAHTSSSGRATWWGAAAAARHRPWRDSRSPRPSARFWRGWPSPTPSCTPTWR